MKGKFLSLCLLVVLLVAGDATAQSNRKGTAGAEYLLIPLTARTTSLGVGATAGLANMSGVEALVSNPAALAANTGSNVLFSRMEYVADIGVNYLGIAQRFGANNIALTLNSWDFGDIPVQTEAQPQIDSRTWRASFIVAGVSYARQFTDRISAGTTVKLLAESIDDTNAGGVAFDAGMTYTVGESGLRFGVSLKNFGPQMSYGGNGLVRLESLGNQQPNATPNAVLIEGADFELPSLLNFGVAYTRQLASSVDVTAIGNFRSNSFSPDQYSGGLEVGLMDVLYLRGGFQLQENIDESFYKGSNFGAGLNLNLNGTAVMVDYAYRPTDFFDGVQMVTASLSL